MADEIYYFCDETSFTTGPLMAVGGLAIPKRHIQDVVSSIKAIRDERKDHSEIKWSNTRKQKVSSRKDFIDLLKNLIDQNKAHFHIRFAPFDEYDHDASGRRRKFDTTSKMFFQLLLHRAVRFYGPHYKLVVIPDNGECTSDLEKYIDRLHANGVAKYKAKDGCVSRIECRNSRGEPLLQLLDVPLGALMAYRAGRHLEPQTSEIKRELAEYAVATLGLKDLSRNSPAGEMRLSVWNAVPQGLRKARPPVLDFFEPIQVET